MMGRGSFFAVVLGLLLAGCTAHDSGVGIIFEGTLSDPRRVEASTAVRADPHTGVTTVYGPVVPFMNGLATHVFYLRGWIDPRNPRLHNSFQIVVKARFERRVYLSRAYSEGSALKTVRIDAERVCGGGCIWYETVGIDLSEADMEAYAARGLVFAVRGRRDNVTVRVPPGHFAGVLAAHRRHRGE